MPTFLVGQWSQYGTGDYRAACWKSNGTQKDVNGATITAGLSFGEFAQCTTAFEANFSAWSQGGCWDTKRMQFIAGWGGAHGGWVNYDLNVFDMTSGTWNPNGRLHDSYSELGQTNGVAWPANSIPYLNMHLLSPTALVDINDHYSSFGVVDPSVSAHVVLPNWAHHGGGPTYMPNVDRVFLGPYSFLHWDPASIGLPLFEWDPAVNKYRIVTTGAELTNLFNNLYAGEPDSYAPADYDSTRGRVVFVNWNGVWSYNPLAPLGSRLTKLISLSRSSTTYLSVVYDRKRDRLWTFGQPMFDGATSQYYVDFATNTLQPWAPSSGSFIGGSGDGVLYDPKRDLIIGWNGGQTIHTLNPATLVATSTTPSTGANPGPPNSGGNILSIWSRFRYLPDPWDVYAVIPTAFDGSNGDPTSKGTGVMVFAPASTTTPVTLCSDLISGPATGNGDTSFGQVAGQDGAYVSCYGFHLWTATATITATVCGQSARVIDAGPCVAPRSVSTLTNTYMQGQMIVVQVPQAATGTGTIVITVNGVASAGLPFTVVPGTIRFASSGGTGNGTWGNPGPIQSTFDGMAPGDVTYVLDGSTLPNGLTTNTNTGSPGHPDPVNPIALVAYPSATVTFGSTTGATQGVTFGTSGSGGNVTIAKFNLRGSGSSGLGIQLRDNCRIVGNNIQTPTSDGLTGACAPFGGNLLVGANEFTNNGFLPYDPGYHTIYRGGRRTAVPTFPEVGFRGTMNYFHGNNTTRAFNCFNEQGTGNNPIQDFEIDHNVIVDQIWAGVGLQNGVVGTCLVHDNLLVRCGLDTSHATGGPFSVGCEIHPKYPFDWTGTTVPIIVKIYGNTFVDCGDAGAVGQQVGLYDFTLTSGYTLFIQGNIHYQSNGLAYVSSGSDPIAVDASKRSNNLWFPAAAPAFDTNSLNVNPQFVSTTAPDYHLQTTSPAIAAGVSLGAGVDLDGLPRPNPGAWTLGAFQGASSGTPPPPAPDLTALVPASATAGGPAFVLTVFGTGFANGAVVTWNGTARTTTFISSTQLTATINASDIATIGANSVMVTNPGPVLSDNSKTFNVFYGATTFDFTFLGLLRDRVGQGVTALAPDGASDGTFQLTLHGAGGRTITGLTLTNTTVAGAWTTGLNQQNFVLGVATSLDGAYLNNATTMQINTTVADGGVLILFASDFANHEFLPGNSFTVTANLADGSSAQAMTTIPLPATDTLMAAGVM